VEVACILIYLRVCNEFNDRRETTNKYILS